MPPATFPTGWLDGYCFSSALSFLYLHINLGAYTQLTFFFSQNNREVVTGMRINYSHFLSKRTLSL